MDRVTLRMWSMRIVPALLAGSAFLALLSHGTGVRAAPPAPAGAPSAEEMAKTVAAIRDEGMNRSQVMQIMDYLCNVIGGRLTGSPNAKRANEWTKSEMEKWGMKNAHLEAWGPFGKGWTLKRFSLEVIEPQAIPIRAFPKAWSPGLDKPIEAEVVFIDATTEEGLAKYKGTLKDKVVMIGLPRNINAAFTPLARRFGEEELAKSETYPAGTALAVTDVVPQGGRGGGGGGRGAGGGGRGGAGAATASAPAVTTAAGGGGGPARPGALAAPGIPQQALAMASEEGAAIVLDSSSQGDGGIVFVSSASVPAPGGGRGFGGGGSAYAVNAPKIPPQATLAIEDYDRVARMIRQGEKVKMAVNFQAEFQTADTMAYNTIAEIPGTDPDPVVREQIVMVGAHMDSWHSGTGATDNGAGCGAALEAVRILSALKVQPRRTIRIGLWTGEEQGLLGSAAYVRQHFGAASGRGGRGRGGGGGGGAVADAATAPATASAPASAPAAFVPGPEFEKLSFYINLDNGTGKIRGIYAMGNEAGAAYFKKWLEPFADLGAKTVTLGTNGQTDHISFDNIGLPGFGFIQDSIDYMSRTHHSSADVYERLQADDLREASTIIAAFLWQGAEMDQRFPRKPAAAPAGGGGGGGGAGRRGGRGGGGGGE